MPAVAWYKRNAQPPRSSIISIIVFELAKVAATAAFKAVAQYLATPKPPDTTSK